MKCHFITVSKLGIFETDTPGKYKYNSLNKRINQDKAHYWIPRVYTEFGNQFQYAMYGSFE